MTKVSKYLMSEAVKDRMFEVFWKSIADLQGPESVKEFFTELLTPTEQVMLAKRLAVEKRSNLEISLISTLCIFEGNFLRFFKRFSSEITT